MCIMKTYVNFTKFVLETHGLGNSIADFEKLTVIIITRHLGVCPLDEHRAVTVMTSCCLQLMTLTLDTYWSMS